MYGSIRPIEVPIVGIHVRAYPIPPRFASTRLGCVHSDVGLRYMGQGLRCWRTQDGGTVCSDLKYHPPGCPSAPAVTESEVLPTPPEAATARCGGGGITVSPSAIPSAGGAPSAFPTTTVLAVGGVAAIGLIALLALRR